MVRELDDMQLRLLDEIGMSSEFYLANTAIPPDDAYPPENFRPRPTAVRVGAHR